jgi:LDH2 family malate/lactate/ureidoglycolate dehydrogenase
MSDDTAPQDVGHFFMAIDVNQFLPLEIFRERMGRLIKEHRSVPRRTGIERIYLPGEIEHELRARRLFDGIPLEPYIVKALTALGGELDVELGLFAPRANTSPSFPEAGLSGE